LAGGHDFDPPDHTTQELRELCDCKGENLAYSGLDGIALAMLK
jgi:hypothetical protein